MIDRKNIRYSEQVDRNVAAANVVTIQEGMLLCQIVEAGQAAVEVVASPAGTEKLAGFALLPWNLPSQATSDEQFVVPSSGSLIFNLRNPNGVSGSGYAPVIGGSPLTVDETNFSATPPTGTVKWDVLGGRLKFAAGNAGSVVQFLYRFNLTVQQAMQRYQERSINNQYLVSEYHQLGIIKGYVEISTDQFDTTVNWSNLGSNVIILGPNGILSAGPASGNVVVPQAQVLAVPDLSGTLQGPFLRISAQIG